MTGAVERDFDAEPEDLLPSATAFRLGGKRWRVKHPDNVDWATVQSAYSGDGVQILAFYQGVLHPDDIKAFEAMLLDPPDGLTLGKVRKAMSYVAEQVLGVPTRPDSGSSTTSTAGARKPASSKARSSSPATRRRASGE